jgi:hypothetical protein
MLRADLSNHLGVRVDGLERVVFAVDLFLHFFNNLGPRL